MDWIQVFVNLILTGILLYVFQRVIDERSARRLEKFKAELQSTALEKEVKFSKLHEIRLQVIADVYRRLTNILNQLLHLRYTVEDSTLPDSFEKIFEEFQFLRKEMDDFNSYIRDNKLYLPEPLFMKLFSFYINSIGADASLSGALISKDYSSRTTEDRETIMAMYKEELLTGSSVLAEKITPLTKEIEKEFRNLLGS